MARLLLPLIAVVALAACGGGGDQPAGQAGAATTTTATEGDPTGAPYVSLGEAQDVLEEAGGLELVRTGIAAAASDVPQPAASTRLEENNGGEFDLLVLPNPQLAQEAQDQVEGDVVRAVNVIAVFEDDPALRERVGRVFEDLAAACADSAATDVDEAVREACSPAEGPLEPREEEPVGEGKAVQLDGVSYRVVIARQLNPAIPPDEQLAGGLSTPGGRALFGVVLQACAEGGAATPDADMRLTTALGASYAPLDRDGPLIFTPEPLEDGECVPAEGSVADEVLDGAGLVFRVPFEAFENRPLALRLEDGGEVRRLELDL